MIYSSLPTIYDLPIKINTTSPAVFGMHYAGSCIKRKNDIRRKHNAKYNKH